MTTVAETAVCASIIMGAAATVLIALVVVSGSQGSQGSQGDPGGPLAWRRNYLGATVTIGNKPGTVIRDSRLYAVVGFPDGREIEVDWAVVANQVNAACTNVEKPETPKGEHER